uniref:Uncharacterized protein n=1 Tax=Salarias fasciatus TaxID=181472 RepID=A0A672HDV8_SALFA
MKIMEQDAEDRRARRSVKTTEATALKDKGNEAFAREDYEAAVKYYSDGLDHLKDMQPLYTNRAQVNILSVFLNFYAFLQQVSFSWEMKSCNERCVKAYLHMGKAFLGLKKYNEARNCFEKIQEIEPKTEKMVKEYLTQVDLEEERESQERNAKQEVDKGSRKATIVPQLLEELSKPGQSTLYYCAGLEILSEVFTDCEFSLNSSFTQLCLFFNLLVLRVSLMNCFFKKFAFHWCKILQILFQLGGPDG